MTATIYGTDKSTPIDTGLSLKSEPEPSSCPPPSCINTVLLQLSIDISLLFMRAGRTLRMLELFSVSQVDAVSVLGTVNKDKAAAADDWRAAAWDWRTGTGAIS